jgi:hypothetical protein
MIEMTTLAAQKDSTNQTIASIDMPTLRARPARVARIDRNDWHSYQLRLVLDKSAQLPKRPFRHLVSLSFPEPCSIADTAQVFKTDPTSGVCSLLNDLLGDFVVLVCLKPPFSPRKGFQFASGILQAFAGLLLFRRFLLQRAAGFAIVLSQGWAYFLPPLGRDLVHDHSTSNQGVKL